MESYRALDVNWLSTAGCLGPDRQGTIQWIDSNGVASGADELQ